MGKKQKLLTKAFQTAYFSVRLSSRSNSRQTTIHNGSVGGGIVLKYTKLDFPTYNESDDPLVQLHGCEKFFANQNTTPHDKVGLAAFHMLGEAQLWFYLLEDEELNMTQEIFKEYCSLHFESLMKVNLLGKPIILKQIDLVEEYQERFQQLLRHASSVQTNQRVDLFITDLIEPIRLDVELHHPPNLVQAKIQQNYLKKKIANRIEPT